MPTVIFEHPTGGPELTVLVPEGGALVDTCDDHTAPVPFSCKSASCGSCRIAILEGASELLPPAEDELAVLDLFEPARVGSESVLPCESAREPARVGSESVLPCESAREPVRVVAHPHRLACQAKMKPGLATLRVCAIRAACEEDDG
jgi:ferredoxin